MQNDLPILPIPGQVMSINFMMKTITKYAKYFGKMPSRILMSAEDLESLLPLFENNTITDPPKILGIPIVIIEVYSKSYTGAIDS